MSDVLETPIPFYLARPSPILKLFNVFRYRQSPEQQEETRRYYFEKLEKKKLAAELKKQQQLSASSAQ
jgi:hypothetical protein